MMRVRDVMTTTVTVVRPGEPVKHAAEILSRGTFGACPVVDDDDRLIGMVSEHDLIEIEASMASHDAPRTVGDIMTPTPVAADAETSVAEIARAMLVTGLRHLPVTEGDRLVGIVSRHDLLRVLARSDSEINHHVRALLHEVEDITGHYEIDVRDGVVLLSGGAAGGRRELAENLARAVPGVIYVDVQDQPGGGRG